MAASVRLKKNPMALTMDEKEDVAGYAAHHGQFHYGLHKILDNEGMHYTYPKEVADRLRLLEEMVAGWSAVCLCDEEQSTPPSPPFKPTWQMDKKQDLTSIWIEIEITLMPPSTWTYFVLTLAEKTADTASGRRSV